MTIEEEIFKKNKPDFKKLEKYGFKKQKDNFIIEKKFQDNFFRAVISISPENKITGKVFDIENNDEFLPLRVESQKGTFVGEVRKNYKQVLIDIRKNCFYKNYFIFPQSNRITDLIIKKFNSEPEFLWEKTDGAGVFRNKKTNKWFGIIMDIDKSRIEKNSKGTIEIMNVKLSTETLEKTLKLKGFYPAYHMNKKYWITINLDNTINDEKIIELVEESYKLVDKK